MANISVKIRQLVKQNPVEFIAVCFFALCALILKKDFFSADSSRFFNILMPSIYFSIIYIIHKNFKKAYYFSWVIPLIINILVPLFNDEPIDIVLNYTIINIICFIVLMTNNYQRENQRFISITLQNLGHFILAGIITAAIVIAYNLLVQVTQILFAIKINDTLSTIFPVSLLIIAYPTVYLYFNNKPSTGKIGSFWKEFYFLFSIILFIYTAIIYFYLIGIFSELELPNSRVSIVMLPYLILALLANSLRILSDSEKWQSFYRYLPFVCIMPLVLLWWGIIHRVNDYGLTVFRIYLIAVAVLFSLLTLFSFSQKLLQYRIFTLTTILGIIITFFVLSPVKIAENNQYQRFVQFGKELNILTEDNKINPEYLDKNKKLSYSVENEHKVDAFFYYIVHNYEKLSERYNIEDIKIISEKLEKTIQKNDKQSEKLDYERHISVYLTNFESSKNLKLDLKKYKTYYPLNLSSMVYDIDELMKNQTKLPYFDFSLHINSDKKYHIDQQFFYDLFKKYDIDLSELQTEDAITNALKKQGYFVVPVVEGGVVMLERISWRFIKNEHFQGYVLYSADIIGYFSEK